MEFGIVEVVAGLVCAELNAVGWLVSIVFCPLVIPKYCLKTHSCHGAGLRSYQAAFIMICVVVDKVVCSIIS